MQRSGPYHCNPPIDKKTGLPLPGLPPRSRQPNPQRGPGIVQQIRFTRTYDERVSLLDKARAFEFIQPRTLRRAKQAAHA
jgi:hypothetical protein